MSTISDIKRLEADLARWRAAFPGKTPEEAKEMLARNPHWHEIDQLKREGDEWERACRKVGEACNALVLEVNKLTTKLAAAEAQLKLNCADWADDDTRVKEIAKPFLTQSEIDGDYGFVGVIDICRMLAEKLAKAEAAVAEMRDALEKGRYVNPCSDKPISEQLKEHEARWFHALSSDCGKDYISRAEAEAAMVEAKAELCELKETLNLIRATGIIHVKPPKIEPQNNE